MVGLLKSIGQVHGLLCRIISPRIDAEYRPGHPTGVGVEVGLGRPTGVGDTLGVGVGVGPPLVPATVTTTVNLSPTAVLPGSYTRQTPVNVPARFGAWRLTTRFRARQAAVDVNGAVFKPNVLPDTWWIDHPGPQATFPLLNSSQPLSNVAPRARDVPSGMDVSRTNCALSALT